ncbi:hypothetical protein, partial [Escherichia coli]
MEISTLQIIAIFLFSCIAGMGTPRYAQRGDMQNIESAKPC